MQAIDLAPDRAVLTDSIAAGVRVQVRDGRIAAIDRAPRAGGATAVEGTLLPGFVDLQVNGGGGHSVAEGTHEALAAVARAVWAGGAVAFLPTLITAPWERLLAQVAAVSRWIVAHGIATHSGDGAEPLGLHVEGPFLEVGGAHDARWFVDPTPERIDALVAAAAGRLRLVTLASSRPGAAAAVARLRRAGVAVAIGHVADVRGFEACVAAGASLATHLFNAMGPMHHREPGIAGLCLDDARLHASLIVDGAHVHAAMLRLAWSALGPARAVLVSDATAAMGMPDGDYRLGEARVHAAAGVVRDAEGRLAGSALTMARAARNLLDLEPRAGLWSLAQVCAANPARLIGADGYGALAEGRRAAFTRIGGDGTVTSLRP